VLNFYKITHETFSEKMITELTTEQQNKLIDHGLKWSKIGTSTDEIDMVRAVKAIKKAYTAVGVKAPDVFFGPFNNPVDCAKAQIMVKKLNTNEFEKLEILDIPAGTEFTAEEIISAIKEQTYGYNEAEWLAYYDFFKSIIGVEELEPLDGIMDVAQEVGWYAPYDKCVFIQNRPLEIHMNQAGQLHNESGPAIKWRGEDRSFDIWAVNGKIQPPKE
jgi:hypothetical protein